VTGMNRSRMAKVVLNIDQTDEDDWEDLLIDY
jgi:hypothetical protein